MNTSVSGNHVKCLVFLRTENWELRTAPLRERLEYALVWSWVKLLGLLPRPVARAIGIALGLTVYAVHGRLRRVGLRNLALAFPEMSPRERRRLVRGEFISLGRQLAEVCLFPRYTRENVSRIVVYDGF